jgi:hypothetical protein
MAFAAAVSTTSARSAWLEIARKNVEQLQHKLGLSTRIDKLGREMRVARQLLQRRKRATRAALWSKRRATKSSTDGGTPPGISRMQVDVT